MKSTGIIRNMDGLGRIVIPVELRRKFELEIDTPVEIYTDGECIVLKKHQTKCGFCRKEHDLIDYLGSKVCIKCVENIKNLKKQTRW